MNVLREDSGLVTIGVHPELRVAVETEGQDWGRCQSQDVVTDVSVANVSKRFSLLPMLLTYKL